MTTATRESLPKFVGTEMKTTDWLTIGQQQIDLFAEATRDHQFIHVDPESAAKTPFGSTIAHGFLSLSMLSYFAETFGIAVEGAYMGINYGFDKVRFIAPVKVNSRIRAHARLASCEEKTPGQFMLKFDVTIEIEGEEKPALKAEWLTMQMVA
ncbi:MaoC family dehydratase [Biformimicrobium ophioploci]|uniref:MaoC family dehydratase n=1 Tax=Biformimicrobium ophioploci TaxID=3036711 RepID=A0ABQ6LVK7_9GAMM|nr:MaoC family dehydratase [Microbulbifer sp. NKW57]GMG86132.1 MaoC family dehydratase [Microbulbifer sp. NKW57]